MIRSLICRLTVGLMAVFGPLNALTAQVLSGRVTSSQDSLGVPGAAITLLTAERQVAGFVRSDSLGRFQLRTSGPGSYRLYVVQSGYAHYVSPEWIQFDTAGAIILDIALQRSEDAQALPAVLISAERESIRKRRVHGRDLRSVDGEIFTRSEVAAQAPFAITAYDIVRSKRIGNLRQISDLCLTTNLQGARRGAYRVVGIGGSEILYESDHSSFGGSTRTNQCLAVLVDGMPWAVPGSSEDAFYSVLGHVQPEDIDWMFVQRGTTGVPAALHIYTKDFPRSADR